MSSFLKPLRVIVSLIFLLSITFIFIDFRQMLPSRWYDAITYFQFVPSVLKFIGFAGILSFGFAVVLLLTLLFGRVYCSTICPLGIFQDVVSFISRKFRTKKFRFKYAKPKNILRYGFLALAVVLLLLGGAKLFGLLDPYSNYGRFFSDLGRPAFILGNNFLAEILVHLKIYSVSPFDIAHFSVLAAIFTVVLLGVVVWLSVSKGRLYCNTVCPVGTFLGLISKFSIFKITMDKSTCTQCAKCAFVCKSQCINIKEQTVDNSRCVGCFNCMKSCENSSIAYKFSYIPVKKEIKPFKDVDESKRSFIANSLLLTGALIGFSKGALAVESHGKSGKALIPVKKKSCSSPPGSKSIEHFNRNCTACHLCVSACPNGVIQPSMFEYGLAGFLQPYMDYKSGFCNFDCTKCGEVCPTGAIMPLNVEEKKTCQVGTVKFIQKNCIVYTNETSCGSCSEHCPTQAVKMVPYKGKLTIPEVKDDICVGCGACEHACPATPNKAIYVEGNPVQKVAKKPEVKKLEVKKLEDFPF
jgi:ferredoxin